MLRAISEGLPRLKQTLPVKLLVLFGSYARGNYTARSDVDLLVVYDGPARDDDYKLVRKTLTIRGLEPHVYSQEEYVQSKVVLDSIIAKGMVLYQEGRIDIRTKSLGRTWKTGLRWMGNGLMGIGVFVLLTAGGYYGYSYYSLAQMETFGSVEQEAETAPALAVSEARVEGPAEPAEQPSALASFLAGGPDSARALAPVASSVGDDVPWEGLTNFPLGIYPAQRIIIPAIGVDSKVVETGIVFEEGEWQWERPKHAVGHLQGTTDPGQVGNIVLSGHISSPVRGEGQVFKRLPEIKAGDVVVLYTPVRAFAYEVVAKKVVLPTEVNVLNPTRDEGLTLITCVPDFIYSHRLIVTAKRVSALY